MKFSRTRLRAAAERALADDKARHDQRVTDWDAFLVRSRAEWLGTHGPKWRDYVDLVTRELDKGRTITRAAIGSEPSTWSEPFRDEEGRTRPNRNYAGPRELLQLLAVLDVVQDEQVTTAGLHALGITGSIMVRVSEHLAHVAPAGEADAA